jgi:hypothetical protein
MKFTPAAVYRAETNARTLAFAHNFRELCSGGGANIGGQRAEFFSMFTKALNRSPRLVVIFCVLTGMLLGTFRGSAATSPLHLSLTEANYDRARGRLALTVRVQTTDLEAALSDRAHRKISVADPGEFAPLAFDYVRETLHLKSPRGEALRLEWAGLDVTNTQVFLFFETPLTGGLQGTRISNTLLQERFTDQINSVELHDGALKQTLVFAHDTGEVAVNAKP